MRTELEKAKKNKLPICVGLNNGTHIFGRVTDIRENTVVVTVDEYLPIIEISGNFFTAMSMVIKMDSISTLGNFETYSKSRRC